MSSESGTAPDSWSAIPTELLDAILAAGDSDFTRSDLVNIALSSSQLSACVDMSPRNDTFVSDTVGPKGKFYQRHFGKSRSSPRAGSRNPISSRGSSSKDLTILLNSDRAKCDCTDQGPSIICPRRKMASTFKSALRPERGLRNLIVEVDVPASSRRAPVSMPPDSELRHVRNCSTLNALAAQATNSLFVQRTKKVYSEKSGMYILRTKTGEGGEGDSIEAGRKDVFVGPLEADDWDFVNLSAVDQLYRTIFDSDGALNDTHCTLVGVADDTDAEWWQDSRGPGLESMKQHVCEKFAALASPMALAAAIASALDIPDYVERHIHGISAQELEDSQQGELLRNYHRDNEEVRKSLFDQIEHPTQNPPKKHKRKRRVKAPVKEE